MFPEGRALEFLLAAAIALVVVGPKDLPMLMRKLGQFMGKLRGMAAEFRASFDEMARQSELDELRKEVEAMRQTQLADAAAQAGQSEVHQTFADIHQGLSDVGAELSSPSTPPYYAAPSEPQPPPAPKPKPRAKRASAAKPQGPAKKPTVKTPTARPRAKKNTAEPGA